jgi:hypothetical protein
MRDLTLEALSALARARDIPLPDERAQQLLEQVNALLAFTRELDTLVTPETMPATNFDARG